MIWMNMNWKMCFSIAVKVLELLVGDPAKGLGSPLRRLTSCLYPYIGISDPPHQLCHLTGFLLLSAWLANVDAVYDSQP